MEPKKTNTDETRSRSWQEQPEEMDNHIDSAFDRFEKNHDLRELLASLSDLGHIKASGERQEIGPEHFRLPHQRP
jgi:hypothetical protein